MSALKLIQEKLVQLTLSLHTNKFCLTSFILLIAMSGMYSGQVQAARTINSATLNGAASVTVLIGDSITAALNVTTDTAGGTANPTRWRATGWLISSAPPGATTCDNHGNHDAAGTYSDSFTITAPATPGTYNAYFVAYEDNACSVGASVLFTLPNAVVVMPNELNIISATVNGAASATVATGASVTVSYTVLIVGGNREVEGTLWRISTTAPGATTCADSAPDSPNSTDGTYTTGFTATAPATPGTYNLYLIANSADTCGGGGSSATFILSNALVVVAPPPSAVSLNRASFDPTTSGQSVSWTVRFSQSVTGVDSSDFTLVQGGGASGAAITGVSGGGTTWTVTANTGTGTAGTVRLDLLDDDTIINATSVPLGGAGTGNGNFSGQSYTLLAPVCTGAADIIFCDDFERSNVGTVGNGWAVTENTPANCIGTAGNARCAGIDSDIPPFNVSTNPRANPTRSLFTRWDRVWVSSPVINMAGKVGGQFSFWMRRGHDNFSECPEATGENYLVEYYASDSTWKPLAQYPSSPSAALCDGAIFTPTIELPADALHANFRLRFYQPSGSGDSGSGGATGVRGYDYWHMDNVIIREKASPSFTGAFCDNFEGSLGRWSVTAEGAPGGATIGDASLGTLTSQSPTHSLDMRWGYVVASTFKTDITGVSGNISYWARSGSTANLDPDNGEDLVVDYLNNAGNWLNLATYQGSAAAGTVYNGSFAIPADAKHANFRLRFRHLNASGYDMDYWHLDDVCVGDLVATADLAITKVRTGAIVPGTNASYAINVSNNGPGTLSGSIVVTDTLPASLAYLSGSGSGWTCSANFQVVTCDWVGTLAQGAAAPVLLLTVGVAASATGTVANTATVSGTVVDNIPGNNTSTDTATLYIPSYVFTDKACTSGVAIGTGANPCNLVNWSSVTAGQSVSNIYVTALNSSGIPTQLSGSGPTAVNFQFALSCVNPTSDAGVQATFSAVAVALPLCEANGAVPSVWTASTTLSFPAASPSVGPYSFNYGDVGKVELYVRNAGATTQIGQSGEFVVRPAGFVLSAIKCTTATAASCGAGALAMPTAGDNPAAATAAGASFIRAGLPFSVTVTAVNSSSNTTPNYGRETVPESVQLTPVNVVAGMVSPPAIAGSFGSFTSGVATGSAFTWGEVGIITLTPSVGDSDYLGAGNATGTSSGNVGRFYPDHFDTAVIFSGGVPMACPSGVACPAAYPGIVYSGQTYSLAVTAKNASGGTTSNYNTATGFSRTATLAAYGVLGTTSAPTGAGVLGVTSVTAFSTGTLTEAAEKYTFSSEPTLPTSIFIRASDGETSSLRATNPTTDSVEGGVTVVSGRIKISNAYGSELLPLSVVASAQYYGGSGWLSNTADTVTSLTFPATFAVGSGSTAVTLVPASGVLSSGVLTIKLAKPVCVPATPCAGIATITPTVAGVPAYLPVTAGQATFGIYKTNNNFIYQRENY